MLRLGPLVLSACFLLGRVAAECVFLSMCMCLLGIPTYAVPTAGTILVCLGLPLRGIELACQRPAQEMTFRKDVRQTTLALDQEAEVRS